MSRKLAPHHHPSDLGRGRAARTAPSPLRCLLVWAALTLLLGSGGSLCLGELIEVALTPTAEVVPAEQAVVLVACVAGLAASVHIWLVASLTVVGSLRGRAPAAGARSSGTVRRLTLLACGVAVSTGAALPSYAGELDVLDGLPYPDRATTYEHQSPADDVARGRTPRTSPSTSPSPAVTPASRATTTQAATVEPARTVRPGDSLWAIASEISGARDASVVAGEVRALHRANRAVIGDDPDLLHPGQRLTVPPGTPKQDRPSTHDRSPEGPR